MKTIQLNLYTVSELEGQAKEKAIENYRYINVEHFDWWDYVYEEFVGICKSVGIHTDPSKINFTGFYSQGDGSTFSADIDLTTLFKAIAGKKWQAVYTNTELEFPELKADRRVIRLIEREKLDVTATVDSRTRGYYVVVSQTEYLPYNNGHEFPRIVAELDKLEKWLGQVADVLNTYLYKTLQNTYEHNTTDEAVTDAIEANEYWFTVDGEKANRLEGLNFNLLLTTAP